MSTLRNMLFYLVVFSVVALAGAWHFSDRSVRAFHDSVSLKGGFLPDPYVTSVTVAGSHAVSPLSKDCEGYISSQPTKELIWSGSSSGFRILATSTEDTTLLVKDPSGNYHCNDDWKVGSTNPMLVFQRPAEGNYTIYVGTYVKDRIASGELFISEIDHLNPTNSR